MPRVLRPKVVRARRVDPFRVSVGDEALVEWRADLHYLLSLQYPGEKRLGEAYAPQWVLPLGPAFSAGCYVSQPLGDATANVWAAAACQVRWFSALDSEDHLFAVSRIKSMGDSSITYQFHVYSARSRALLVEGHLTHVAIGPRGPCPYVAFLGKTGQPEKAAALAPSSSPRQSESTIKKPRPFLKAHLAKAHFLRRKVKRLFSSCCRYRLAVKKLRKGPGLVWTRPKTVPLGGAVPVDVEVRNTCSSPKQFQVEVILPFGHGLDWEWLDENHFQLDGLGARQVSGRLSALRPHEVNLGRPWRLVVKLWREGVVVGEISTGVRVPDPRPGKVFYVLTEDCESFDGGPETGNYGAIREFGNQNNFMDPEDYRIQMIHKPEALNAIADRHGAHWTHFWTATQRFAAAWAAQHSSTGAWEQICEELDRSIKRGALRHEYAPHIHFDFEPDSELPPQPRLLYDHETDGLLPNEYYDPVNNPDHCYHGWDGGRRAIDYVKREGSFLDLDSKTGSLRKSLHYLAQHSFGGKSTCIVRTGARDFGFTAEDLEISACALRSNGLLANSDAPIFDQAGNHPRGRQIYLCQPGNPDLEIERLEDASLVQLRCPGVRMNSLSPDELDRWFDQRFAACRGPGVHGIVAMTHAMFMRGEPDPYRDTRGGDFDKIDSHLEYVRLQYPGVKFVTASEAVLEFLDYYSPEPRAVAMKPRHGSLDGRVWIFPIRILGEGIPISPSQPKELSVQVPTVFNADDIRQIRVLEWGKAIVQGEVSRERLSKVHFRAYGRDGYDLEVRTAAPLNCNYLTEEPGQNFFTAAEPRYEEYPGEDDRELFRWEWPRLLTASVMEGKKLSEGDRWEWYFPTNVLRLLGNPICGWSEPLGRRMHPYAGIDFGAALYVAEHLLGPVVPLSSEVKWLRPIQPLVDMRLDVQLVEKGKRSLAFDCKMYQSSYLHAEIHLEVLAESKAAR